MQKILYRGLLNVVISDLTMGNKLKEKEKNPEQMPHSHRLSPKKVTPVRTTRTPAKSQGQPMLKKTVRPRNKLRMRASYTEEDMLEAIRLVHEEEYSITAAARHRNNNKHNEVPRQVVIKTDRYLTSKSYSSLLK